MDDTDKFMIVSYAGSLFEDVRNDGWLDVLSSTVSDAAEMFDRMFFDDFMNQAIDIDYTDNCSRDIFRAEIEKLCKNYFQTK